MTETYSIITNLWIWTSASAPASWHFLTISGESADAIRATALMRRMEGGPKRGWGTIKVAAEIGDTRWNTSIFPAKDSGGWLLPVKAAVRKAEALAAGDQVAVTINL